MKEIYIRKMRYEEAYIKLDREIQAAFMEGETFVEVVHGIGEGILKKMTEEYVVQYDFLKIYNPSEILTMNPGSTKIEISGITKTNLKKWKR